MSERASRNVFSIVSWSGGQIDLFQGIKIEVFLGCDVGCMRAKVANSKKERLVAVFPHEVDRRRRDQAIGLFLVGTFRGEPTERRAYPADAAPH